MRGLHRNEFALILSHTSVIGYSSRCISGHVCLCITMLFIWNGSIPFGILFKVAKDFIEFNSIRMCSASCLVQWGTLTKFIVFKNRIKLYLQYESIISHCSAMNIFRSLIRILWSYSITLIQFLQFHVWWKDMLCITPDAKYRHVQTRWHTTY